MTEIIHHGMRLVPSRESARRFNITNDYIGRLCKQGKVSGSLISGSWYVNEESLRDFLLKTNREKYERREALREQRAHAYREAQARLLGDAIPAKRAVIAEKKVAPLPPRPLRIHPAPRRVPKTFTIFAQRGLAVMFAVIVVVGGLRFSDASVFQVAREVLPAAAAISGRNDVFANASQSAIAKFLGANRDNESYWIWYETSGATYDQPEISSGLAGNDSVIGRVIDAITPGSISEAILNARLAALESRLMALISIVPPTNSVAPVYHYYVDNSSGIGGSGFDDIDITNSTYTGGTITGATITGGSVTATEFDGVLPVANGGTGTSTYAVGDILYADSPSTLGRLAQGTNGQVLKVVGGNLVWSQDIAGGGGSGAFATTSDDLAIYVADPSDVVIIGSNATSTTGNILEIAGNTLMRGALTAYNTITGPIFTATSTTATSTMPRLNITGSLGIGSDYITDISGDGLSVQSGALALDRTGDWTGTFDGLEGSYYLANSFSTTSASYFISQQNLSGFSTTSADYWKTQRDFFATTSVEYWKSVSNFFSTTSAAYFLSENQEEAFSTTSAAYFLSQQNVSGFSTTSADFWQTQRNFFSTTSTDYWKSVNNFFSTTSADFWKTANNFFSTSSAQYFVNSSTTIPKTYTANTFTALQTFGNASSSILSADTFCLSNDCRTSWPSAGSSFAYPFPNDATSTTITFNNGIVSVGSTTINGNATTTGMQSVGSLYINGERFTDLTGSGLLNTAGVLSLDTSGNWTGTFDGQEGSYYLANSFSTTSASYFSSIGLAWSTTSANYYLSQNGALGFSTTSNDYWMSQRNFFSTTSANYWQTTRDFFSTTSAAYFLGQNQGAAFSTTSANYWESQQTARTADDLSNNSIEDLSDVAAMTENYGDLLYWNGSSWADIATSSLGLVTSSELGAYLSLASWYATTTDGLDEGSANLYFTNARVQSYLDTVGKGYFFSTTSADAWKDQRNFFSTTSAAYFSSVGLAFSTTSNDYWASVRNFFSTTSASYFLSQNQGAAFSSTSANYFIHSSTTVPKLYTSNTWTGGNIFGNATTSYATTTNLFITDTFAGAGLGACNASGDKLVYNANTKKFECAADAGAGGGITSLRAQYSGSQTGSAQVFATSSDTNLQLTITSSGDTHTFTPVWSGVLAVGRGGTGISSTPNYGQVLVGDGLGGYMLAATSSLGLSSASFSTTSADYWQSQRNFFSTTSTDYWKTQNNFFSTTSSDYWMTERNFFSTTSASYFLSQNQGNAFSTTSAIYFAHSSTTIPKTYTANTFTALQNFANASSTLFSASYASTTALFANTASTSNLTISALQNGLLKVNASGVVSLAVAGTDYQNFVYPFPSNATSTLLSFNGGLIANASSSINALSSVISTSTSATSTNLFATNGRLISATTTNLGVNGETFTDLTGSGLLNTAGVLSLDTSGNWTGTFDGQEGSYYLANGFSTTSANYWQTTRNFFSTTSADYWGSTKGYSTFAYPFPSNATSTMLTFNGGLTAYASSTFASNVNFLGGVWDASGNLGIGNTSPSYKLDVTGTGRVTDGLRIGTGGSYEGVLHVNMEDVPGVPASDSLLVLEHNSQNVALNLFTNNSFDSAIYFGDNVNNDSGRIIYDGNTASLALGTNDAIDQLVLTSNGRVGIGTAGPTAQLNVHGDAAITGALSSANLTATGTIVFSGIPSALLATDASGNVYATTTLGGNYVNSAINSYIHSSTTISKLYTANTFTALQTFANASSTLFSSTYASSTRLFAGAFTLGSLNGPLQANNGVISATSSILAIYGGTGQTSYSVGDILYADSTGSLAKLPIGGAGTVLKVQGGLPSWQTDLTSGGGGGATAWSTTTDSLAIYPTDTTDVLIVGSNATATTNSIFEVFGRSYFSNNVGIGTTSPGSMLAVSGNILANRITGAFFTATSTTASVFPYASTTALSATTLCLASDCRTSWPTDSEFSTTSADYWKTQRDFFSTTSASYFSSIGLAWSTTSANYYLSQNGALGFSTTSNDYWMSQRNFFSTTSANYWSSLGLGFSTSSADAWKDQRNFFSTTSASYFLSQNQGNAFSTTSANYWETQQTVRTADDLTNNSIEDLQDVAAMTENYGDLLYWNGSSWADIATSSLGLPTFSDLSSNLANYLTLAAWYATTTDGLDEGATNLYFTNTRVQTYLDTIGKGYFFSTTSADAWKDQRNFFSTTSAAYFTHSSTTIAKTYTANAFTALQTFTNASSTLFSSVYASSTVANIGTLNLGSALTVSNGGTGSTTLTGLLKGNGTGAIQTAIPGVDYLNSTAGDWTGTFDGQEGSYYLANSFSTSSANYWQTTRDFFSTTSAIYFAHSSTTIPKTYTANVFTALQNFANASSTLFSASYASTTNLFANTASTSNLTISALQNGLLKVSASGVVSLAVAGTDYQNFAYPFPSNATSTLISFNGGLTAYASSTVGNGTQTGGLTISGGATTTGNAYFAGNVSTAMIRDGSNVSAVDVANRRLLSASTVNAVDFSSASAIKLSQYTTNGFLTASGGNGTLAVDTTLSTSGGNLGVGTSSPYAKLSVAGEVVGANFTATTTAVNTFPTLMSTNASTTNFGITGVTSALLATDANGRVYATTSISSGLLNTTGDWTGTFDGQEGSYYLANSFSTTSTNYWQTTRNFFSTTSADYWETQQTARTADDLTNNSIEDLQDVAAMTENYGDLLGWNGSTWTDFATSSLGIAIGDTTGTLSVSRGGTGATSFTSGSLIYGSGTGALQSVATTTATIGGSLTYSGTFGALVGGSSGTLSLNLGNANTWTALQQFGAGASSTALSAYNTISVGRTSTTTIRGDNQASTLPYASTTAITATTASTTNLIISGLNNGLLKVGSDGTVSLAVVGTDYSNFAYPFPSNATSTLLSFNGGLIANASSSINALSSVISTSTNATSTTLFATGSRFINATTTSLGINSETFTDLTGTGLQNVGGALTLNATGDWTGTFDGQEGSYYLANSFSTTSADYWKTQRDFFSTTSAVYFVHSSTTIPKTYTANAFTALQNFANASSTLFSASYASTTALFANTASTSNLTISALQNGLLKVNASGVVSLAVAGTDYQTFGYLFPNNATSTLLAFNGGLTTTNATSTNATSTNALFANVGAFSVARFGATATSSFASNGALTLATALTVPNGGTGATSFTSGSLVYGSGTGALQSVATTTATLGGSLSYTGTFGALVGGSSGTLSLNMGNANTWTALQTFANASSTLFSSSYASTTNLFAFNASTSNLTISSVSNALLKTNASGQVAAAVLGTDYQNFAYPFGLTGNATSSLTQFNGGLTAYASSTIGAGGQTTGLTISGGATTTGYLKVLSTATSSFAGPLAITSSGTSTFANGIQLSAGCFRDVNGNCIGNQDLSAYVDGAGSGSTNRVAYWSDSNTLTSDADFSFDGTTVTARDLLIQHTAPILSLNDSDTTGTDFRLDVADGTATFKADVSAALSNEYFAWTTNNNEKMRLIESGNLGIGATGPRGPLDVMKNGFDVLGTGDWMEVGRFVDASELKGISLGYDNNNDVSLIASHTGGGGENGLAFWTYGGGWGERMRLSNTGNLGIGTTTPQHKLSITDASAPQLSLSAGAGIAQWTQRNAGGNLYFSTTTVAGTATTTIAALEISGSGFGTTTVRGLNINGQATSTSNVGFNLTAGCYAINGMCITGGSGSSFAYPFSLTGNATSTLTQFNGGLTAYASTTIGAGGQTTGLTISGGATTTGNAYFAGNVGINVTNPSDRLEVEGNINLRDGYLTFQNQGYGLFGLSTPSLLFYNDSIRFVNSGNNLMRVTSGGSVGIGTTSPYAKLSVVGDVVGARFIATTSTASIFPYASTTALSAATLCLTGDSCIAAWPTGGGAAYPFSLTGNATSTLTQFNGGLTAYASSTIGDGTQTGGLMISGGATTTGNSYTGGDAYFATKVGIGTSDPDLVTSNLTIVGSSVSQKIIDNTSDFIALSKLNLVAGETLPVDLIIAAQRSAAFPTLEFGVIGTLSNHNLVFATNDVGRLTVTAGGNVGIGTTSPSSLLTVFSTTSPQLSLSAGGGIAQWTQRNAGGNLYFSTTTLDGLATTSLAALSIRGATGNVGVGTSSPGTLFSIGNTNGVNFTTATTTFGGTGGIDLRNGGCFAINGTCIGAGGAGDGVGNWFTGTTNFNAVASATTTPIWLQSGANLFASSTVRFGNAGVSEFFYNSSIGNLGLGTTTPFATLQIATTTGKNLILSDSGAGINLKHWLFSSRGGNFYIGTTTDLYASSTIAALTLNTNGNLGVGTTTPYAKLSVVGGVAAQYFNSDSSTATSTFAGGLNVGNGALKYDYSAGLTTIQNLAIGAINFDADGGILSWVDMPVTSSAAVGTVESYSAQIDGTSILTVYSESDGIGGIKATSTKIGIGTTTPFAKLAIQASDVQTAPLFEIASTSSATKFLSVSGTGFGTTTLSGLNISGSATSTSNVGFNITAGCYAINGTCITGGGGGGSGGGSWSTTTSPVSGQLVNYPNNATDVVAIGSNSTTTAEYWFDPNAGISYLSGNVGIGTLNPVSSLDLGPAANGRGIAWGGSSGNANYSNIFSSYSAAALVLATGLRASTTADVYESSYGSSISRTAIRLNPYGSNAAGSIQFFTDSASTVAVGTAITPTERVRITSNGSVGIGTSTPYSGDKLSIYGGNLFLANTASPQIVLKDGAQSNNNLGFRSVSGVGHIGRFNDNGTLSSFIQTFDLSTGNVGIGSTTPWAKLSIVGNHGVPQFIIATTSDPSGDGQHPLFIVQSTTTGKLNYQRIGMGTTTQWGNAGLRDQLVVDGRIYSTWRYAGCDFVGGHLIAALTADTANICGPFSLDVQGTVTGALGSAYPGYYEIRSGTVPAANTGTTFRTWSHVASATTSPVMEAMVQIGSAGTATTTPLFLVGFYGSASATTTPGTLPANGAYFVATSTNTWRLVTRKTNVETITETNIATSSTSFQRLRVELTDQEATFLINGNVVGRHTTNIPVTYLSPAAISAIAGGATSGTSGAYRALRISMFRLWVDDPPGGIPIAGTETEDLYNPIEGADIAEAYLADDPIKMIEGSIVSNATTTEKHIARSSGRYDSQIMGVIATSPKMVLGDEASTTVRVGMVGRVPVIVSLENGAIKKGDPITSSSLTGIGMKARRPGAIVGKTLAGFDPENNVGFCDAELKQQLTDLGVPVTSDGCYGRVLVVLDADFDMGIGEIVQDAMTSVTNFGAAMDELMNTAFEKGAELTKFVVGNIVAKIAIIEKLFVRETHTQTLCIADGNGSETCITKAQLDALLANVGVAAAPQPQSEPETQPDGNASSTPPTDSGNGNASSTPPVAEGGSGSDGSSEAPEETPPAEEAPAEEPPTEAEPEPTPQPEPEPAPAPEEPAGETAAAPEDAS
ncbi:hypothetical protein JNK62_02650 [bacterium]|nr:hypothetical protein [bacterium]